MATTSRPSIPMTTYDPQHPDKRAYSGDYRAGYDAGYIAAHEERGLDVERLGEAVFRVGIGHRQRDTATIAGRIANSQDGAKASGEFAEAIAAEYARLATPEAAPEDRGLKPDLIIVDEAFVVDGAATPEAAPEEFTTEELATIADARMQRDRATPTPTTEDPHSVAETPEDH